MTIRAEVQAVIESIEEMVRGFASMSIRVQRMARQEISSEEKRAIANALRAAADQFAKVRCEIAAEVFS